MIESKYPQITEFACETGAHPRVVVHFEQFGSAFNVNEACQVTRLGAIPLILINPIGVSIARIARGQYRAYLTVYATAVKKFGDPVAISFGHEMNGTWYSWGYQHTPPGQFVRAWRVIHETFAAAGASNVTWVWTVNSIGGASDIPLRYDWPGAAYVNWVGVDAYYWTPAYTFDSVFAPVLDAVRTITHHPVLIAGDPGGSGAAGAQPDPEPVRSRQEQPPARTGVVRHQRQETLAARRPPGLACRVPTVVKHYMP